jgi:hypothetical protein
MRRFAIAALRDAFGAGRACLALQRQFQFPDSF